MLAAFAEQDKGKILMYPGKRYDFISGPALHENRDTYSIAKNYQMLQRSQLIEKKLWQDPTVEC